MSRESSVIFGIHAVDALLRKQANRIASLAVFENRADKKIQSILQLAKDKKIKINLTSKHDLDKLACNENHQGVVAICEAMKAYTENDLENLLENANKPLLLILDGVQDPHNLGACLRSADAAGVLAVIAPRDKAVGITPVVSKVASGAVENVPFIQVTNLARTMRWLQDKGIWIFGAAEEAEKSLFQAEFDGPVALVLGAEGSGLRRLTREHCDILLKIPMHGVVSSLNVSVATGIFLFEAVRQRGCMK